MSALKMYDNLAAWWPLLSPPEHYVEEAAYFLQLLRDRAVPDGRTMVEFGSGGGSNAYHLKQRFTITLVDLSPDMLTVSRAINPECEHLVGDMRSARLGRLFDVVFIHDAIMYMQTESELRQAIETAFVHCRPGGLALFVPDCVRETFRPATRQGGEDGEDRALRYLEWEFDPDASDSQYEAHFAFLLREGNQVHVEHDEHRLGLFAREDWRRWLRAAGFQPEVVTDPFDREVFIAARPSG